MSKLASLVLLGFVATGCHTSSPNEDSASAAIDSSNSVESEGNVMMAVSDGVDQAMAGPPTSAQVAAYIAANLPLRWSPSSCVSDSVNANVVTVTFNDCTGPRGLLHVTGTLTLTVTVDAAGIHIAGSATNFEVNKATLDINTNALYSVSGAVHQLAVQTEGTGTGALGNQIDHQGNYTIDWDTSSQCGSIAGMWQTEITTSTGGATRSNDVNLMRCAGGCPTGTIVHTGFAGVTLTVTFDGTPVATWSTSTGKSGTFNLACQ